jgi:hypothetical protein
MLTKEIVESSSFKEAIYNLLEKAEYTDYVWDGESSNAIDAFSKEDGANYVVEYLKSFFNTATQPQNTLDTSTQTLATGK